MDVRREARFAWQVQARDKTDGEGLGELERLFGRCYWVMAACMLSS